MSDQDGNAGFRVEFEAELHYSTGGGTTSSRTTEKEPGYLSADAAGAVQYFDTPKKRGWGSPHYEKAALFDVALADVASLRWNEATGAVHIDTAERKGRRSLRPMYYSKREESVPTAERLADLWFQGVARERTQISDRERKLYGTFNRVFSLIFFLIPFAVMAQLLRMDQSLPWVLGFGAFSSIFALVGIAAMSASKRDRAEVAALVAEGKTWVKVVSPSFHAEL